MSYRVNRLTTECSWLKGWQMTKWHLHIFAVLQLPGSSSTVSKGWWNWSDCEKQQVRTELAPKHQRGGGSVPLWLLTQWRLSATLQNIGITFESPGAQRRGCHFFGLFMFTVEVVYLDFHLLLVLHSAYNLTEQAHAMWNGIANWWWSSSTLKLATNTLKLATQNKVTILCVFWE